MFYLYKNKDIKQIMAKNVNHKDFKLKLDILG